MRDQGRRASGAIMLAVGVAVGWAASGLRGPVVRAGGGDRSGESIVATGPVYVGYDEGKKVQIPQEALYYLDYKSGRLLATVPSFRQSFGPAKLLDSFAERDLVADFKLDLDAGARPRFLMTTGSLGAYSEGSAPLYVVETTTGQVAAYKVRQQVVGTRSQPQFELIEVRPIGRAAAAP
jgi:hypothetical protein